MVILLIGSLFGSGPCHKQIKRYVCRRTELLYQFAFSCNVCNTFSSLPLARRLLQAVTQKNVSTAVLVPSFLHCAVANAVVRSPSVCLAFDIVTVLQRDHVECAEDWEGCST